MKPRLPDHLLAKSGPPCKESSGPLRVKLILKDGRPVYDVFVGEAGEIVMAGGRLVFGETDLRFRPSDIVEVSAY